MHLDQLEKLYKDLPTSQRERWPSFQAFRAQTTAPRQTFDVGFGAATEEHKAKLRAPETNEFGGLASAFGVQIDSWMPTFIEPGSFKNTLADSSQRSRVKVLYQHSFYSPIGVPTLMEEVKEGLLVMGRVSETQLGKDTLLLMRDGVINEMSIGFDPVEFFFKENKEKELCRHITECRLWEFSPVSFGANKGAKIQVVNSLEGIDLDALAQRVAERMRSEMLKSPDEVRAEIARLTGLLPAEDPKALEQDSAGLAQLEELSRMIAS